MHFSSAFLPFSQLFIKMIHSELAKEIVRVSYLKGEFRLRSGQISSHYFDKYQFESNPLLLKQLAKEMVKKIPPNTEILAGLELGGVPLATAISLEVELPVVFVRKTKKEYGTEKIAEGFDIQGKKLCVIEDVITTGGQVVKSTEALRNQGAIVDFVLCVIWRGRTEDNSLEKAGIQKLPLFDMEELSVWMELS
ncbi:orotate phosphoribosyltransferase [Nostoc sp. ChiSLP03a]|uniref:orotate phosphoribosyltransferase n=1 Tax=Nostoc sp. ChiSLP03a TaxID=3075380 RepID=UPI002AD4B1EC|nr:orotate phosphoribosyltransferase [Nostoc sp. ChiSLP03a]MDZ8215772.1 orotate phosphoribosyltransferase [Nostoc sp. ChiSLP03a]